MIQPIVKDPIFLMQKSAPAAAADYQTAQDLVDTLEAHKVSSLLTAKGHIWSCLTRRL